MEEFCKNSMKIISDTVFFSEFTERIFGEVPEAPSKKNLKDTVNPWRSLWRKKNPAETSKGISYKFSRGVS